MTARTTALACHPDFPCDAVHGIEARVERRGALLALHYVIQGRIERLRVPQPRMARPADGLWRHTCCEIFVARKSAAAYHEFNFSPSAEWAAYAFARYREGGPLSIADPGITLRRTAQKLELDAVIPCDPGEITVGLCAVIEGGDGSLSYWALRHAPGKPDFHHRDALALELE
jgi:hypothetical protein